MQHKKIAIIGCAGSGKTSYAKLLHKYLNIPLFHLDQFIWKAGWKECEINKFRSKHLKLISQNEWIIDGNQMSTLPERIKHADIIIYLDIPRYKSLWRIVKRWYRFRNKKRDDLAPGCYDTLSWGFLSYIWRFNHVYKPYIMLLLHEAKHEKHVYIIKNNNLTELRSSCL